jgi:polyhydroxyalkanoate synthesis regulator phasin
MYDPEMKKVAENLAEYLETCMRNRVISKSFSEVIISLTKAEEIFAPMKEQEERIKDLEHQLETLTRWRMNAGAFD